MLKRIISIILVLAAIFVMVGCSSPKPLPETDDSTLLKNPKKIGEYLKSEDYKSISYAYMYNLVEGLNTYKVVRSGSLKAKILFIDYDVQISSSTIKNGNTYYGKQDSESALTSVHSEYYLNDKNKILISGDMKEYKVYSMEDYLKTTYAPYANNIVGYAFNDKSILKAELVSKENGIVTIKYTLDNELATSDAKKDMKTTGDLSDYPVFSSVVITLSMKEDYTPVSFSLDAVYDVSKPVLGSSTVTQHLDCKFESVNEKVEIPNEAFLIEKLGQKPSELVINKEVTVKDQLLSSLGNMGFDKGVNIDGTLTMELTGMQFALDINTSTLFDISKLNDENLYSVLKFHAGLKGNEIFNSLISLVKSFAGNKLGKYSDLIDNFAGLDVYYSDDGTIYVIPYNTENKVYTVLKLRLVDILDLIVSKVNIYGLISGSSKDLVTFEKTDEKDEKNYSVNVLLNEETVASLKETINGFLSNPDYSMIKTFLGYEDFGAIDIRIDVTDDKISKLEAGVSYMKTNPSVEEGSQPIKTTLVALTLESKALSYDFAKISDVLPIVQAYDSAQPIKTKLTNLAYRVYLTKGYVNDVTKAIEEYNALSDNEKLFINSELISKLNWNKELVGKISEFLKVYSRYDLDNLSNADILALYRAYREVVAYHELLSEEIGEDNCAKLSDLSSLVDYSLFDSALSKIKSADENEWNLTTEEINDIKVLIDFSKADSSVQFSMMMKLYTCSYPMDLSTLETKIQALLDK